MSSIAHGAKKRFSLVTTRTKTREKNMPAEYTTKKHALQREKKTLESTLELIDSSHNSWKSISLSYKKFAELVSSDAGVDTVVFPKAGATATATNELHDHFAAPRPVDHPPARLLAHVKAFIAELETIEKECKALEEQSVEKSRYEKKTRKLEKKTSSTKHVSKAASEDKTVHKKQSNIHKLEEETAKFDVKFQSTMDMLKKANAKFEKVLHCAHSAFWLEQDEAINFTAEKTASARADASTSKDELVAFDLGKC